MVKLTKILRPLIALGFLILTVGRTAADDVPAVATDSTEHYDVLYSVEYAAPEKPSRALLADIYRPKTDGPFPTILMIHGGAWMSGNKTHVAWHARYAATQGYAVVAINYRLAPAAKFPAQLEDCRKALDWIGSHAEEYGFDTSRVAAYGYSAGAHLACLLGVTQNEAIDHFASTTSSPGPIAEAPRLRAIVAGGTPCEFSWIPAGSERLSYWLGGSRESRAEVYRNASPVSHVDSEDPPVYLFHGAADRVVPVASAQVMKRALVASGVPVRFRLHDQATHIGAFVNRDARRGAIAFLDEHLKSAPSKSKRDDAGSR